MSDARYMTTAEACRLLDLPYHKFYYQAKKHRLLRVMPGGKSLWVRDEVEQLIEDVTSTPSVRG